MEQDDAYAKPQGCTKVEKVYCKPCFDADVSLITAKDEMDLTHGRRNEVRSKKMVARCTRRPIVSPRLRLVDEMALVEP